APIVRREVHDRGRAAESGRAPQGRRPEGRGARSTHRSIPRVARVRSQGVDRALRRAALVRLTPSMRLLLTNDDGFLAHGLECLVAAAEPLGEVAVVAHDREQSARIHSLTRYYPLR